MSDLTDSTVQFNLSDVFGLTALIYIAIAFASYFVIYIIIQLFFQDFFKTQDDAKALSIDLFIILVIFGYFIEILVSMKENDRKNWFTYLCRVIRNDFQNPKSIFYVSGVLIFVYMVIYFFKVPETRGLKLLTYKSWVFLAMLIIINFMVYGLKIPIVDILYDNTAKSWNSIRNSVLGTNYTGYIDSTTISNKLSEINSLFPTVGSSSSYNENTNNNECDIGIDKHVGGGTGDQDKEVFNISCNSYTYDDATEVCSAYGGRLATYGEVEAAYNKGAEWCNYGWTQGQLALFPTQKETWQKYQKDESTKHACGRPGINGGYIEDKNTKYGVNCYGKKPAPTEEDLERMKSCSIDVPPKEKEVNEWADKLGCLTISSYNNFKWSGVSSS